jgi:hypothetical protein
MTGGTGSTDLHEFVPKAGKNSHDDTGALPGTPAARFSRFQYGCWLVDSLLKLSMADSPFCNSNLVAKYSLPE